MIEKRKNHYVIALRSLANDLAVCDPTWTPTIQMLREAANELDAYIKHGVPHKMLYDPNVGDDKVCTCGHPYYRHFDSYKDMYSCGCKYCGCFEFVEATEPPVDLSP